MTKVTLEKTQTRFFLIAAVGLIVDLSVASALVLLLAFSEPLAAALGLAAGTVFNYFSHLFWTFRDHNNGPSIAHFTRFATAVGITLVVRLAFLTALNYLGLETALHVTVRLGLAAAVSFFLSYYICSRYIFRAGPEKL